MKRFSLIVVASLAMTSMIAVATQAAESPSSTALMKLLRSDRLPASRKPAVVELICGRGGPEDLAVMLRSATAGEFDAGLTSRVLALLTDAAEVRKVRPAGDLSAIRSLMGSNQRPAVRAAAVRLAAIWHTEGVADELRKLTASNSESAELREAAVDGLAAIGDKPSAAVLKQVASSVDTTSLRLAPPPPWRSSISTRPPKSPQPCWRAQGRRRRRAACRRVSHSQRRPQAAGVVLRQSGTIARRR
ncbi:MAG: hypothetical protein QM775_25855 [Pirellulales bacterium]